MTRTSPAHRCRCFTAAHMLWVLYISTQPAPRTQEVEGGGEEEQHSIAVARQGHKRGLLPLVAQGGQQMLCPGGEAGQGAVVEGEEGGWQGVGQVVVHDHHRKLQPARCYLNLDGGGE